MLAAVTRRKKIKPSIRKWKTAMSGKVRARLSEVSSFSAPNLVIGRLVKSVSALPLDLSL